MKENIAHYEVTFEDGSIFCGTAFDIEDTMHTFTRRERTEMGDVKSLRQMTEDEWNAWCEKVDRFMMTI